MKNVLIVVFGFLAACAIIAHCAEEPKKKTIKSLGWPNYVVELEDGHQYIENRNYRNLGLSHYPECPKCKQNERDTIFNTDRK